MRILLIGAYGFIGSEIARALMRHGHDVRGFGRDTEYGRRILPMVEWWQGDLADHPDAGSWVRPLTGVDAVVNASGLLQDEPGHAVAQVQQVAIAGLITASEWAGMARYVQISAANAEPDAASIFLSSKAEVDRALGETGIPSVILRPGLVIGRNAYGGSELIRMAAAMPLLSPLPAESAAIQCVGMGDLTEAVVRALDPASPTGSFDLVERQPRSLANIVALHREWLGFAPARWTVSMPSWCMRGVAAVADGLGRLGWRSPLRTTALVSLAAGVSGNADDAIALIGHPAKPLETVLSAQPAGKQDRIAAQLALLMPIMLASLFLLWMGSAIATFCRFEEAVALLRAGGLQDSLARLLAGGGALVDAALALAMLHRRTVRRALLGTIAVTVVYLFAATVVRPDFWLDPLAPLLKVVPAATLSLATYVLLAKR
jgi:uncharacterized protein YbjT (DUF2867 family)